MASVDESQVVNITLVRQCRRSRSQDQWWVLIVTWCCYNNSCSPYIRSQASSSPFSETINLSPITLPNVVGF